MGFFSPKKTEDASFLHDDKTIVQVIRSRLVSLFRVLRTLWLIFPLGQYGKQKGKERERPPFLRPSISFSNLRHSNVRPPSQASPFSEAPKRKPLPDLPSTSASAHGQRHNANTTSTHSPSTDTVSYAGVLLHCLRFSNLHSPA